MNFKSITKHQELLFFILLVVAGVILWLPYQNFQLNIAQGDHGNNLYCFEKTFEGQKPYRDFWWVYGPLMLYYYSFFYYFFGVSIHSVLIGYAVLNFLCGIVIYLSLRVFLPKDTNDSWLNGLWPAAISLAATLWFWVTNTLFEHTYNHAGGVLMMLTAVYTLFLYIKNQKVSYLYAGLLSIFILSLIKFNMGISTLAGFLLAVFCIDWVNKKSFSFEKKRFYLMAAIVVPILIFGVYWLFLKELPLYALKQCFPYFSQERPIHNLFSDPLKIFWEHNASRMTSRFIVKFSILLGLSMALIIYLWRKSRLMERKQLGLGLLVLFIFSLLNLHEFWASTVSYRIYWIEPLQIMACLLIIAAAARHLPVIARWVVCILIIFMAVNNHLVRYRFIQSVKQYVPLERGKIFVGNQPPWLNTVVKTVYYLEKNLKQDETFLAVIDGQLYYFLTDKDAPYRQTELAENIYIDSQQEAELIATLEEKKINYVLLSNRYRSTEYGLGIFGKTYCRTLAAYIREHYKPAAVFGPWDKEPRWSANHGVMILRRNESPPIKE